MLEVRRYKGLQTLPKSYGAVFEQAGRGNIFLSCPWFHNFEQTILAPNESTLIYGVEEKGPTNHPLGALVLKFSENGCGLVTPRTIESLSNYYTSHFGLVVVDDSSDMTSFTHVLASALWADRHSWDMLRLQPLDPALSTYAALVSVLRESGILVQTYFCFGNWYLELAGRSYREYFNSLSSVLRKNIPYLTRRLEKTYRLQFTLITDEEGLAEALYHYERVYTASWREPEPYPQFIRGLARIAMMKGWLRLGILYLDDKPAAAQLWIVHAGVAYIYKICYDECFSKLSVGTVLTARMMEHVIDVDKVRKVDYLSGDDAYKKDWMSHRAERWGILAFNPYGLKGLAQATRHIGGRFVKRTVMRAFRSETSDPQKSEQA